MRKVLIMLVCSLLLVVQLAHAQDVSTTGAITAGQSVQLTLNGHGTASVTLGTSVWTGSVEFEVSNNGTIWAPIPGVLLGGTTVVTTSAADGVFEFPVGGFRFLRVSKVGGTGTVQVAVRASAASTTVNTIPKGTTTVTGAVTTGGLTDAQLRATPVDVVGPLTDAELRAAPVPVSAASLPLPTGAATEATVAGLLTDTQLRATPIPVSGTVSTGGLTDTQLRATPVPVSGTVSTGGLTDTQLRATPVPVSATDLDIRDLASATDKVGARIEDAAGNAITSEVGDSGRGLQIHSGVNANDAYNLADPKMPLFPLGGLADDGGGGLVWTGVRADGVAPTPGGGSVGLFVRQIGLPEGAALADSTANPTLTQIQTFPMVWSTVGSVWHRWTGSVTVTTAPDPEFSDVVGTTPPPNVAVVGGWDGTNTQRVKTDTAGEIQADILTLPAIPAGNNNIGDVDVASVVPGTAATNLGKAEDAPVGSGDTLVGVGYQRKDTPTVLTTAADEYSLGTVDAYGAHRITMDHVNRVACNITSTATTSTVVTGCAAPGAGLSIYMTSLQWHSSIISSTTNFMTIQDGTGGNCGAAVTVHYRGFAQVAFSGREVVFNTPIKVDANSEICFLHPGAGTRLVTIQGFIAP